jgi:3-methyladenine DNA glycosylase/8-oxoguanine DNA glycosylase
MEPVMRVVADEEGIATVSDVPGPEQVRLTPAQARQIDAALRIIGDAERRVDAAERRYAELCKRFGFSAVSRHVGLTPEAIRKRATKALARPKSDAE